MIFSVDSENYMVGSFGPKKDAQDFLTPPDTAPGGMLARGSYTVKCKFTDDDKSDILTWEWVLEIKKDWA